MPSCEPELSLVVVEISLAIQARQNDAVIGMLRSPALIHGKWPMAHEPRKVRDGHGQAEGQQRDDYPCRDVANLSSLGFFQENETISDLVE